MGASVTSSPHPALSWRLKAAWACGSFGAAVMMAGISSLMLFYLTTVVQLDAWLAGMIIFLSKIYDAVSDPISGHLSDRTRSRMGRRRPWLFFGAVVSAAAFLAAFTIPFAGPFGGPLEDDALIPAAYVLLMLVLYTTGYSMFSIPHTAMPAEMTQDYHERSSIHGYRMVFGATGGFFVQAIGGIILERLGKDWDAYALFGLAGALTILVTMVISFAGTRGAPLTTPSTIRLPIAEQLRGVLANRAFLQILGVKLVQLVGSASIGTGLIFFYANVLRVPLDRTLPVYGMGSLIGIFTVTPLLLWLARRIGKRNAYFLTAVLTGLTALSWIVSDVGEPLWAIGLRGIFTGIAFAGNVIFAMSMLTDAMEVDTHRTGLRREGLYASLYTFVEKLATATAPLIVGTALSLANFDVHAGDSASPHVRQAALLGISYVPAVMAVIAMIILSFYRLDERILMQARDESRAHER